MILNRLLFLYFIQKKGWLNNNPHYLYEKFWEYHSKSPSGYTFYSDFLIRLFQKLSNEQLEFKDLGDVPFLNGGLFEIEPFSSKVPFNLKISNSTFKDVFDQLLEHFNFTVREDTPLDIEVAIDPEMLGRIFENLILQLERDRDLRKMTGSYYTPRVIVHFMCQQALKEYLASESQIDPAKLEMLSELNPPDQLEDWQADLLKDIVSIPEARLLRDLAKRVFVLDPAVGSGAFLVGMLHEILALVKYMDVREHGPEHIASRNYDYELKRDVIENCLYGVDILEQAVRICELRLWLSLVVDYEKVAGQEVPPLPNLSYRVRQGDSLIETLFGQRVRLDTLTKTEKGRQLVDEIQQEKHAYFLTRGLREKRQKELSILVKQCELAEILVKEKRQSIGTRQRLFGEMTDKEAIENEEARQQIAALDKLMSSAKNARDKARAWLEGKLSGSSTDINKLRQALGISFVWRLDFAEVFKAKDGFDMVIQNPPYVNMVEMDYQPDLYPKEVYKELYSTASGGFDLFVLFHEISVRLLKPNGIASIICPNKYLGAEYAKQLRNWLGERVKLLSVADVSAAKPFDAAVYPVITLYQRTTDLNGFKPYEIAVWKGEGKSRESIEVSKRNRVTSNLTTVTPDRNWSLLLQDAVDVFVRLFEEGIPLGTIADVTGGASVSEAYDFKEYVIDASTEQLKSNRYAPLIVSGNIRRYYSTWGVDKTQYIKSSYLHPVLDLKAKVISKNRHMQIKSPKLIISGMAKRPRALYDPGGAVAAKSTVIIYNSKIDLKYICGILNSELYAYVYYCLFKSLALGGGYLRFGPPQIKALPILKTTPDWLLRIVAEVDKLCEITGYGKCAEGGFEEKITSLGATIDSLVYDLHDITDLERHRINQIVQSLDKRATTENVDELSEQSEFL